MDENEVKNQPEDVKSIIDAEEVLTDILTEELEKVEEIKDVAFRHPQQLLTNKQIQSLFLKKGKIDEENAEREKRGEEPIEGLTETEKGAITLFLLRARSHGSKPKQLSTKERTARKAKRKTSKKSRKLNR